MALLIPAFTDEEENRKETKLSSADSTSWADLLKEKAREAGLN